MGKVLVVDDSPIVTKMLQTCLSQHGLQVSVSNSSFGVSNMIREFQPHVLLMDMCLPGLGGEQLLTLLQEANVKCHKIIVSSAPEPELQQHVQKGIADDYYIKGSPIDVLVNKVLSKVRRNQTVPPSDAPGPDKPLPNTSGLAAVSWKKELEIGVDEIDADHREIFSRFNDLLRACSTGRGRDEVVSYIGFLQDYVEKHFASEEAIQLRHGYPEYEKHRKEHEQFKSDMEKLQQYLKQEGSGLSLVIKTNRITFEWLLNHISNSDQAFGEFLLKIGVAKGAS